MKESQIDKLFSYWTFEDFFVALVVHLVEALMVKISARRNTFVTEMSSKYRFFYSSDTCQESPCGLKFIIRRGLSRR